MDNFLLVCDSLFTFFLDTLYLPVPGLEDIGMSFFHLFMGIIIVSISARFVLNILGLGSVAGSLPTNPALYRGAEVQHKEIKGFHN